MPAKRSKNESQLSDVNTRIKGIDISHYQNEAGKIDWAKVSKNEGSADPVKFVFIKLTEGATIKDAYGQLNASDAHANTMPFGLYHFLRIPAILQQLLKQ